MGFPYDEGKAFYEQEASDLSCSVTINEVVLSTCNDLWTDAGGNVTAKAETDTLKEGTACCELDIAAGQAAGMIGYTAVEAAAAGTNINTAWNGAAFNYLRFWFKSTVALASGDFTIGLDNAATFNTAVGAGHRNWAIPAILAANVDVWHLCQVPCPRTLTDGTELASIDSVGITMVTDVGACVLHIDDIRLTNYSLSPSSAGISIPLTSFVHNTDLQPVKAPAVLAFPYLTRYTSTNELPQDMEITWYKGAAGAWASTDVEQGTMNYSATERLTDVRARATSCAIVLGADLGASEYIELMVEE